MTQPSVDIVILNYNTRSILEKCLPQVIANSNYPNCNVVVVDNASTDDSVEFIKATYPNLELVVLPYNSGFAGGYNLSLKNRTADYFV
ncbi:MAG: glycosyltransferase, partial [Crocinitomicaceae bacterium]|nr:glycosyltransferase [Crocinitomicaceae bacterium]